MKILRILPAMDFGGIERGVRDFSLKAAEMGHNVVIASGNGRFIGTLKAKGIKFYDVPMEKKSISTFFKSFHRLSEIIVEENPDILHVQSRFPCWIMYHVMKNFPNRPWVTSIHSFNRFRFYSMSEGKGDLVIVVSKALKKHAIEYLKVSEEKIRVVYNGISTEFCGLKKKHKNVICIGMIARFSLYKGHYYFLQAMKLLKDNTSINALIVGSGSASYRKKLEKWISNNRLTERIKIANIDGKEALKNIDILVVPSFEPEGFGRTVVEAQMSMTPVIGTNIGAIPELIEDGKTGFLVEPRNPHQIVEKIKYIIQHPTTTKEIVQTAYKNALDNFTVEMMVQKTLQVYQEIL